MTVELELSARQGLTQLLVDCFDARGLSIFVELNFVRISESVPAPESVPLREYAFRVVDALIRRGLVTEELFDALARELPRRFGDIERVAALFRKENSLPAVKIALPARQRLARFLIESFDAHELTQFIGLNFGSDIRALLPERTNHAELVSVSIDALERRALLDQRFFQLLTSERPNRAERIEDIAKAYLPSSDATRPARVFRGFFRAHLDTLGRLARLIILIGRFLFVALGIPYALSALFWPTEAALNPWILVAAGSLTILIALILLWRFNSTLWGAIGTRSTVLIGGVRTFIGKVRRRLRRNPQSGVDVRGDRDLVAVAASFFARAGREPREHEREPDILFVPEVVLIATHQPPQPEDAHRFREVLAADTRAFFAYRGTLSTRVLEILDDHRLSGHPIAPVSYDTLRASLDDGSAVRMLAELEQHFRQQNLYEKKNALWDERFFFGREVLLARVGGAISGGDGLLITGLRKSGKSSFINILRQRMIGRPWCLIDLQKYGGDAGLQWPMEVAKELIESVDRWGESEFRGEWPKTFPGIILLSDVTRALAARSAWMLERRRTERPVLVLDEVERVFSITDHGAATRIVDAGVFRAASQAGLLTIVAADLRPTFVRTNVLYDEKTNPFYEFMQVVPIGLFTRGDTQKMLRSIGRPMGITDIAEEFIDRLQHYTGGHPGLARTIAAQARQVQEGPGRLTSIDLDRAFNKLHRDNVLNRFFQENIWGPATQGERAVMDWIVDQPGPASHTESPAHLQSDEAWASLTAQGVLADDGDRYTLSMGGLKPWIEQKRRLQATSNRHVSPPMSRA
jgi:hypothetical protein